jgi:Zn-dependent membrane protease YugP
MPSVLLAVLFLALFVAPQLWVLTVMRRHASHNPGLIWTGGAFARFLLDQMRLNEVKVEETDRGDHYHPLAKAVRLSSENFHGRSLTAIVVAAHEVGHAMQEATDYAPLRTRTRLADLAQYVHVAGTLFIVASPAIAVIVRHPAGLLIGAGRPLTAAGLHLVTLPVEFDASFNRALRVLKDGGFLPEERLGAARHILSAAAFTYVAQALTSLFRLRR